MAKLFKWLMVLLIPLFSLTLTSCGDDDKDEPDYLPTDNFLVGEWCYLSTEYSKSYINTLSFESDGKYDWTKKIGFSDIVVEERGSYSYSNGILTTVGRRYYNGTFFENVNFEYDVFFDDYISKLIVSPHVPSDFLSVVINGQYSKIE